MTFSSSLPRRNRYQALALTDCRSRHVLALLLALVLVAASLWPAEGWAQATLPAITSSPNQDGSQTWSLSVETLALLTLMSFLPAILLMMTGFTRIIIVLGLLRNAMGTGTAPPNSVLIGLALFLTFFTMGPVFDKIYDEFSVSRDDDIETLKDKDMKVLVIAEPWCGHCMLNLPILLRISEAVGFDVRFSLRDENLDLMEQYQTNGKNVIPRVIVLDADGNERAAWGPIAPLTKEAQDKEKQHLPKTDAPDYDEKLKDMRAKMKDIFSTDEKIWLGVYEDIKKTLLKA